ncbi:MAG: amidohydrolase family protein [Clostridia bacterium]|nr:amidohydrolase family protein [Clostridia bacterium]
MRIIDIDAHPPVDAASFAHFFDRLNDAGIGLACGTLYAASAPDGGMARRLNEASLALAKREPRYIPALWGHPDCADQVEQARMIEIDGAWLDGAAEVLAAAQERGLPVSLRGESPAAAIMLAERYPSLKLICGGFFSRGFMPAQAAEVLAACPNVYLNLSGGIWIGNYVLHEWSRKLHIDRLLFGTGCPDGNPAAKLAAMKWELRDADEEVHSGIYRENARKLLGLEA